MTKAIPFKQPRAPRAKAAPFLLVRFGGQGDALFLTPVAAELQRRGFSVHIAVNDNGLPLVQHLPFVDKVFPLKRDSVMPMAPGIEGHPCDLIERHGAWQPVEAVYPHYPSPGPEYGPFAVANYRYIIESNSLHPWINRGQNSNFINTYDLHFSWAGIDPTTVPAEHRRPRYVVTAQEREAVKAALKNLPRPIYLLQTQASSAARSYYRLRELYQTMHAATRGTILAWNGNVWETNGMLFPVAVAPGSTPMRMSAAMVEQAALVVSADTAISHIAEALDVQHLTFYSTVPAWTRSRDYTHEITIDLHVPDSRGHVPCKCGVIARDCPRIASEAYEALPERTRELLQLFQPQEQAQMGIPVKMLELSGALPWEHFNTTPAGLEAERQAALQTIEGARQRPAHCIASLDLWPHVEKAMKEVES